MTGKAPERLALKVKPLLSEIAKRRMKAGKADPNQKSDQGMTSKKLGKLAGVSHDTIYKVEKTGRPYRFTRYQVNG